MRVSCSAVASSSSSPASLRSVFMEAAFGSSWDFVFVGLHVWEEGLRRRSGDVPVAREDREDYTVEVPPLWAAFGCQLNLIFFC